MGAKLIEILLVYAFRGYSRINMISVVNNWKHWVMSITYGVVIRLIKQMSLLVAAFNRHIISHEMMV